MPARNAKENVRPALSERDLTEVNGKLAAFGIDGGADGETLVLTKVQIGAIIGGLLDLEKKVSALSARLDEIEGLDYKVENLDTEIFDLKGEVSGLRVGLEDTDRDLERTKERLARVEFKTRDL